MNAHESDIIRRLRLIEELKAELVASAGALYRAVARKSEQAVVESLANVVIFGYVLGRRLGVSFRELEDAVLVRLDDYIRREHEVEKWFGDFSEYRRYLRQNRVEKCKKQE